MTDTDRSKFEQRIKRTLDESVDQTAPEISNALYHARKHAISNIHKERKAHLFSLHPWLPAGGLAITCVLALTMYSTFNRISPELPTSTLLEMKLLSSSEPLEFYDDFEFYEWLESQENEA